MKQFVSRTSIATTILTTSCANSVRQLSIGMVLGIAALLSIDARPADAQTYQYRALGYAAEEPSSYDATIAPDTETLAPRFRRTMVAFDTREAPGTIVIDTKNTYLYLV